MANRGKLVLGKLGKPRKLRNPKTRKARKLERTAKVLALVSNMIPLSNKIN